MTEFAELKAYLEGAFQRIGGWCNPALWQAIAPLASDMLARSGPAPVAEIGVHHGRFLIGLIKTMGTAPGNVAIDVFDRQELNLDASGRGNRAAFLKNLADCGVPQDRVRLVEGDSLALGPEEAARIRAETGGVAMFSVDGCHMAEHTVNDLAIAMAATRADGLIFVDDYYNPNWPGVQEGVAKMYLADCPRFVPLAFLPGKLILCHLSRHGAYFERLAAHLAERHPETQVKRVPRFGYRSLTVAPRAGTTDWLG